MGLGGRNVPDGSDGIQGPTSLDKETSSLSVVNLRFLLCRQPCVDPTAQPSLSGWELGIW